jgi:hypothetical protein
VIIVAIVRIVNHVITVLIARDARVVRDASIVLIVRDVSDYVTNEVLRRKRVPKNKSVVPNLIMIYSSPYHILHTTY